MTKSVEAIVKPELLVWARKSAGLTIEGLAKKVQVRVEKVQSWEEGEARPTFNQLLKLAKACKRPAAVFYLPEPPKDFQPLKDFRRLYNKPFIKASPNLIHEMRLACERREIALELFEAMEENPPVLPFQQNLPNQPEELASAIRRQLHIDIEVQKKNKSAYKALRFWRTALEDAGVLMFQASGIDINEMRGFSIGQLPLPVIVVNSKDHPRARCFTMLHEFVHILSQTGFLGNIWERRSYGYDPHIEAFCNRVAGEVLVPTKLLLNETQVKEKTLGEEWSDRDLSELALEYGVSREVILRRLLINHRVTEELYRERRKEFVKQYEELRKEQPSFGPPPHRKVLSSAGTLFTRLVLDSYHREYITSSDLSDFLDVKLGHLGKIEAALVR